MRLALPYVALSLLLLTTGIWQDSDWLAVAGAVGAAPASYLLTRAARESQRTGQLPK